MFKLLTHKLRMELEELKHKHRLEMEAKSAEFIRAVQNWEEDRRRLIGDLKKEHDLKLTEVVTLAKLDWQQKAAQAELNAQAKLNEKIKQLTEANYKALTDAMTKLHEEGNVTTRFTQDLALKMFESMPSQKNVTRVLTGKAKDE